MNPVLPYILALFAILDLLALAAIAVLAAIWLLQSIRDLHQRPRSKTPAWEWRCTRIERPARSPENSHRRKQRKEI